MVRKTVDPSEILSRYVEHAAKAHFMRLADLRSMNANDVVR